MSAVCSGVAKVGTGRTQAQPISFSVLRTQVLPYVAKLCDMR